MTGAAMTGPDEQDALAELIDEVGARWDFRWGTMTGLGQPLEADPKSTYRRARDEPTIVAYTVAEMRQKIREADARHACEL